MRNLINQLTYMQRIFFKELLTQCHCHTQRQLKILKKNKMFQNCHRYYFFYSNNCDPLVFCPVTLSSCCIRCFKTVIDITFFIQTISLETRFFTGPYPFSSKFTQSMAEGYDIINRKINSIVNLMLISA
ncbi:hypothetical protein BpHYR1_032482 [Brachionus plicatilis]|uniref:Uncharacterized protein n=1 Tax=Brachionus plicatilis TaxID=10195 RepID=A0A3M7QLL3_BRAPC|nr:hypothetical protein BpHYR1_032482 [Brachionus plicatilis]